MRKFFDTVLNNYHKFYNGEEIPLNMKELIKKEIPEKIIHALNIDLNKYWVFGSTGIGNLTETPWIAIFDKSITTTAQRGFYIVYLFRKDMEGVYLSLNQGTTYLQQKFKGNKPRDKMKEVANSIREELDIYNPNFPIYNIDLTSYTTNAKNYEAANICAKLYEYNKLPTDQEFYSDISVLLAELDKINKFIGNRMLSDVIDNLLFKEILSDAKYQEEILFAQSSSTAEKPLEIPGFTTTGENKSLKRNPDFAREALEKASFQCELDSSHKTFVSPITKNNFVEAHHLIPIKLQREFNYSLDVPGNIVSLCPNCHRKIHYGIPQERNGIIKVLYNKRKDKLNKFGIFIELSNLIKKY